jgi:2-keto-3-deoxy-L-fuconate dehydrogenase
MAGRLGSGRFIGKRVLVTSADLYMGPAIVDRFAAEGAVVIADSGTYDTDPDEAARLVAATQPLDVVIVNLLAVQPRIPIVETTDEVWQSMFDRMATPTMRLVRAVVPQMIARRSGKIVVITSAAPLRGVGEIAAYSAARGAQNAFVRSVGAEIARHNVQINAVGQNYVYGGYPADAMDDSGVHAAVMRDVPAQRLAEGWEQAELVLFLASQNSNFISGQVVPFAGGWVT